MAYREPCSSIYLFKGCPCDASYNNTIYFEDKTMQWVYFRDHFGGGRTKSYTSQYYQRYAKGTLRIQERADNLYEFNYMAFCNDNGFNPLVGPTGNMKVFYCFIDSKEYINENVTEITYTIDVMQTYMFNYTLGNCFVEREHTLTDNLYENLIEENFEATNYTEEELYNIEFSHWCVQIQYIPNRTNNPAINNVIYSWRRSTGNVLSFTEGYLQSGASFRNHTYVGYTTLSFPIKTSTEIEMTASIQSALNVLVSLNAVITNVYIMPYELITESWASVSWNNIDLDAVNYCVTYKNGYAASYNSNNYVVSHPTYFMGKNRALYYPRNKKLYMYPYQSLKISNSEGESDELMFENFDSTNEFKITGCENPIPELTLYPLNYNGKNIAVEHRISLTNIISCVWSEDSATRFWNENKNKINSQLLGSAIMIASGIGLSLATENPLPAIAALGASTAQISDTSSANTDLNYKMKTIIDQRNNAQTYQQNLPKTLRANPNETMIAAGSSALAYQVANLIDLEHKRDVPMGKVAYSTVLYYLSAYGFKIIYKCIKPYEAERIDGYFDMFGYAIKNIKVPNIFSASANELRPHWNYIKNGNTVVLPVTDNNGTHYVESDVEEALQAIYNKGITFWMDGEEVGDYSLDNSPNI